MTTLAVDTPRVYELGRIGEYPVIASDIIYEGAAVGVVDGTGHARPLTAADRFVGFAEQKADNSAGTAAAKNVRVIESGQVQLSVSGAVITDVGQPIYATDDNAFAFSPVGGVFIGTVSRFVSSGIVIVAFDVANDADPYAHFGLRETLGAATKTLDAQDTGKLIWVTVDSVITLPATATALAGVTLMCGGPFGTVQISADPNASDKIMGPDLAGTDNKDLINTKATARRGDYITLTAGHTDGYVVNRIRGTWASE
jgi:hypothetical protein